MVNINLLPKELQRRGRVDPYKLGAAALPVLALLIVGVVQLGAAGERARLESLEAELQLERTVLQRFVAEQADLQARRVSLSELQGIAEGVRQGQVIWSEQLFAMLETRPLQDETPASRLSFRQLEMRALDPGVSAQLLTDNTYEGLSAVAEMDVAGLAGSAQAVADYVRELQAAPNFAVVLRDMARDDGSSFYSFSMTIGAAALGQAGQASGDADSSTGDSTGDSADSSTGLAEAAADEGSAP